METQLAAMQEQADADHRGPDHRVPDDPAAELTVDAVCAHRPALGVRADPTRTTAARVTGLDGLATTMRYRCPTL